jgi:hypothetical protein
MSLLGKKTSSFYIRTLLLVVTKVIRVQQA